MEKNEKITKRQDYKAKLETTLADTDSKVMVLESRVNTTGFKLKEAKVTAREAKERT